MCLISLSDLAAVEEVVQIVHLLSGAESSTMHRYVIYCFWCDIYVWICIVAISAMTCGSFRVYLISMSDLETVEEVVQIVHLLSGAGSSTRNRYVLNVFV